MHEIVRELHHFGETMIDDRKTPVGAEHAQAMRHVVQRGVELVRQRRLAFTRHQRAHENFLQAGREVLERQKEHDIQHPHSDIIGIAVQCEHQRQWSAGQQHLHVKDPRASIGATGAGSHVAERHGYADQMRDGIVADHQRDNAP